MHRIYVKLAIIFCVSLLTVQAFAQNPSIGVQVSPTSLCVGDIMTVVFTTSDTFASDNVYTVLLSDSAGDFMTADTLDTISGQAGDTLYIPTPLVTASTHYKVSILGSDPVSIGAPTISDITIRQQLPAPNTVLTPAGPVYNTCTKDSVNFKFSSFLHLNFTWYFNDSLFNNPAHYTLTDKDSGTFIIEYQDTTAAGCARGFDTVLVAIHAYPAKPTIGVFDRRTTNFCGSGKDTLFTRNNPTLHYQWLNSISNDTIAGATDTSYVADSSGLYILLALNSVCAVASNSIAVNIDPYPVVTFTLPSDSFCLYSPPIQLTGGLPAGGQYSTGSADYTDGDEFEQSISGPGTFTVYYTYSNAIGCSAKDSSQISIFNCTTSSGLTEVENDIHFSMYPNPASGSVIFSSDNYAAKQIRLISLVGQEVFNQKFDGELIYGTSSLSAGVYLVEVTDLVQNQKSVQRLIIQ